MDWKQLEQDREDGTPGPWEFDPDNPQMSYEIYSDEGFLVVSAVIIRSREETETNARRIARVPDLEALALAGRELAEAADCTDYIKKALEDGAISDEWAWIFVDIIKEHDAALAAWRKAEEQNDE